MDYQQLFDDFPALFRQDESVSCPFDEHGCEFGPGWLPLVYDLASKITAHARQQGLALKTKQIKTKFGSLRWYIDGRDEQIGLWIDEAIEKSERICEDCGCAIEPSTTHTCHPVDVYSRYPSAYCHADSGVYIAHGFGQGPARAEDAVKQAMSLLAPSLDAGQAWKVYVAFFFGKSNVSKQEIRQGLAALHEAIPENSVVIHNVKDSEVIVGNGVCVSVSIC